MNHRFRISTTEIVNTGRIFFTANQYDPTTACVPLEIWSGGVRTADSDASKVLFIQDSGHTEDCQRSEYVARDSVLEAQKEELQTIIEWLRSP